MTVIDFNRVEAIKYFISQDFSFDQSCEMADSCKRQRELAETEFQVKVADCAAVKIGAARQIEADKLLWDAMDAVGYDDLPS